MTDDPGVNPGRISPATLRIHAVGAYLALAGQ